MSESENMNETKKLTKSYFDVLGICCTSEVVLVEKILKNLEGVKDVSVIVPTKTVIVIHDSLFTSQQQIVKALNQARLEASIKVNGVKHYQKKWPSPFAIGSGILLALSFLKYFFAPFQWLALGAVAVGIPPIIFRGLAAVRNLTLDINILVLIAVAGSIVLHDYWEAGTIVFLFTIAEWLESRASHKATAAMSSLVNIVPPTAVLAESGEEVNVDEVKLNSILAVKAGETIPIDGVVVEGDCDVDERTLTGESFPVPKQKDSTVWAGTTNLNGYISVKTTALAEDCAVARMAKLVEDAQNNKSKTQRYIDKCAKYYTPVIVAISASLAIVPTALRVHNRNEWYRLALVALVSACPCALVLSTPVAMCCALSKAASSGLLFKGAEYLETLAKIKIMAFDKTGTITRGEFVVTEFRSLVDGLSLNTLLYWVSSIESKSGHPMAAALVDYAQSNSIEAKPDRVEKFQNFPGEGIYGRIDGREIYVGNKKISSRAGCTTVPEIEGDSFQGKSVGYIFLGSSPAGLFSLSDVCRTGVKDAIIELKKMGIKTAMLTGDCYAAANHVQDQLGGALEEFQAELLPEDKATIIKGFQKEAPTAMIGDGLNDAPALATADIGISMGISGSALAKETGHVILMTNDIGRIPKAARLARRVRRKIIENMVIAIGTKAAIVALAIAGYPLVWAAVLADTGTCLLVILNSMLLLRGTTRRHGKQCYRSSTSSHAHHHKNQTPCCKSENAPQLCCSDIESQKKCTRPSCSSEVCVPRSQPVPSGWADNQCHDSVGNNGCHSQPRPQCCSSKMAAPACQSAVSESQLGKNNCSDSTHKKSCHSSTNSLICISQTSPLQCHSATSSSKSCGSTKCSNLNEQNGCQSHTISQTCSAKKSASACQSAVSGSKSCGNSKCSDTIDKNTDDLHPDYQTCMSKMCAPQSQSTTSCSRTCGNTKCSDTTSKNSCCSHTNSESCSSNIVGPVGQTAISGSRSCGNNKCLDSGNKLSFHSNANPLYEQKLNPPNEEKLVEQESFDLVQKDMKSNHDRSRCCSGEEPDHPNSDKAYDSCELQECCYSVQGHNTDISETEIQETAHCDSTNQRCSSKMSALGCQSAISGSKACGDSKCSDMVDKNSCHSHTNPQACPSKMCAAQCQSMNTTSRSCGNTKCSDSISKSDGHTQYKSESCLSKMSAPTCQTAISGSTTCGNIKSVDSLNVHGCHSHANSLHKENLEQDRLCVSHGCPSEKQDHSNPDKAYDSCSTQDCCVSVQDHGSDISESGSLEAAHSDRARQSTVVATSCKHKPQDHVNQCGLHSKSTPTDEELAKLVRKCCKHRPCPKVHSGCRKHAAECSPNYRSTINILRDNHSHHFDCSGHKVCSPLEKRQAGGCCESFRKECCAKKNHLAASLGGGLSEIVIE